MASVERTIKRKRRRRRLVAAFSVIVAIVVAVCVFISRNVNPMILILSDEKIKAMTNDAINSAVLEVMAENTATEYMSIVRDSDDNIKSVDIDAVTVSELAEKITIRAQQKINDAGQDGIKIPLGSLSGVTLFTGLGPDINIKIYLVGSTQTKIISTFTDSGINQTLHRLYLDVTGAVAVAIPGLPSRVKTSAQVLMGEMIIIGAVPPTYLHAATIGDMLDLVVD